MRRKDREVTDIHEIFKMIDNCPVIHIAMTDNGKPYVVALNFGYERQGDDLILYFHSAYEGRKIDILKKNPEVYRMAATQFGVAPDNCVLLEDAPHNCAAAKAAGLQVVGVYDEFYDGLWPLVMENSHRAVRSLEELL